MPSRSEKTNVRGTYSVREGFKRIDDLFDSNPTRSRTSITSDSIKMRSRIGKTANTESEKNRTIQGNERSKDLHSSDIEKEPSRVVDKVYSSETVMEPSISESGGKNSINDNAKEPDAVQSTTESKRVLIFDGENMVVEGENNEQETIIEADDMNQDAGVVQKSIVNEAMNASEEITLQQSHLNDVDVSSHVDTGYDVETSRVDTGDDVETSRVDTGYDLETSRVDTGDDLQTSRVDTCYDVETSRVDTNYDVETTDSGPVIIGSFSSNDIDMETNTNESESVLTENDSIFDYKQQFQGIDSYFDSMESNAPRESYSRESYSRQYRKETPSYSRTKSMPYGNTGRTNRYSSLPSTVDDKIEEIRARYNSRNIETNVDAPSSSYFSNVGRSYDYGSSLSDRRSFLTKSHSTVGTSDSTSRSESVLSRIMNRSFKSIDDYFDPQKDDVVLKRRTTRTARTEKTTQEADTETVSSEYNRRLLRHDINISSDTSERTLHDTETGASQKTDDTEIESGTTLKSDVTERESNFIEEFESETISYMTGVEDDLSEETYTNVEDDIVNPTNEADDNVDDISEEESEEQTEIVEMEQNQPDTYIVESGDFVHLDPEAVPITEKSIEDKSGYENQG
ncbi:hypothetical protein FSP39_017976 [Pinctada imbricata]|uniref:Uncharacterized protein n=1 Tax=Pinctada imbricata TaxID=66713 RepID=A0AA88YDS3_PINIB|nr:hypothetical protein FSP39_017976 [Pinctada imbricata]